MNLTARWAKRSQKLSITSKTKGGDTGHVEAEQLSGAQALFGIIQGASHLDLRRNSLEQTVNIGFDGYASVDSASEKRSQMFEVIDDIGPRMPEECPRYLMGVGTPEDLVEAVARGIDMFDCVLPTRNGRTGQAFTSTGKLNIKTRNGRPTRARSTSRAPVRFAAGIRARICVIYMSGEMLASILLTHHNLAFFLDTMRGVRQSIRSGDFPTFRREFTGRLGANGE